jgi:hypothetical protein
MHNNVIKLISLGKKLWTKTQSLYQLERLHLKYSNFDQIIASLNDKAFIRHESFQQVLLRKKNKDKNALITPSEGN